MITDQQFKDAALLLKRHTSPDAWVNFMGAFSAYTYMKIGDVTDAPLENVVLIQGMARMCKKIHQLLDECEPTTGGTHANRNDR